MRFSLTTSNIVYAKLILSADKKAKVAADTSKAKAKAKPPVKAKGKGKAVTDEDDFLVPDNLNSDSDEFDNDIDLSNVDMDAEEAVAKEKSAVKPKAAPAKRVCCQSANRVFVADPLAASCAQEASQWRKLL